MHHAPLPLSRIVVVNDHSTASGGKEALVLRAIRHYRAQGIPVSLVCGDTGHAPELEAIGVQIMALGKTDLLSRAKSNAMREGLYDAQAEALVRTAITKWDSPGTIYHVHGWEQILSPAVFKALRAVAPRTFLHAHDTFLACPNGMFMDYQRSQVCTRVPLGGACLSTQCDKRSYLQKMWRSARHRMLLSCLDRTAPWAGLITIHPDVGPKFIRAGYPEALLRVVKNPARAFRSTRIPAEENRTLIYVGRLERDKGVVDLVAAAGRCKMPLTLIGDGPLRDEIARTAPWVTLSGWQAPEAIGAIIGTARGLVMPSHHPEPFALVIPEAVQSGLPVLVAETAVLAPQVQASGFGFAFNVFDPTSFDQALLRLRDMERGTIQDMSVLCHTQGQALSNTYDQWGDDLLAVFQTALVDRVPV